jgi:preprotein translocase subunit SecF
MTTKPTKRDDDDDKPAAVTHKHKFRYLLPPGNNFAFVAKFKIWLIISVLLMAASISVLVFNKSHRGEFMNWTIDFKGGTQVIFAFRDKAKAPAFDAAHTALLQAKTDSEKTAAKAKLAALGPEFVKADPAKVRDALAKSGEEGFDVSDISWQDDADNTVNGMIVSTPRFSALKPEAEDKAIADFTAKFKDREIRPKWSGDRLFVKTKKLITFQEVKDSKVFETNGLELKDWLPSDVDQNTRPDEGTKEYTEVFSMWGVDRQYEKAIEAAVPGVEAGVQQSYGVGAKAGDKLRDDAAKSIVYAIFLIMLYLAFRFDIRYAPGAAFATIHDAIMVIGVFALTWTEVSLTSVAGLLTVMGYSVNDTVIVFDRIRENQAKLKDKKIERIIDISINEMLVRTILTSSTVFATTLIMNIFGTGLVKNFAFAMNIGVIVGTYSSIFLAAPIFMYVSRKWYSGPVKKRAIPAAALAAPTAEE